MFVIGVTGSIGTGKTTVAGMFEDLGAKVLDADKIAHTQIENNSECVKKVIEEFGEDVLSGGSIDRHKLAEIVFKSKVKLTSLERIIHPEVKKVFIGEIKKNSAKNMQVLVLDVPLLFESGFDSLCDFTIVVTATREEQLIRASRKLNISKAEVLRRIAMQTPLEERAKLADVVIENINNIQTKKQVREIWQKEIQKIKS